MPPSKQPAPLAGQLIIAAFFLALVLPFIGSKYINGQIQKEQGLELVLYGDAQGGYINNRADEWFRLWSMKSGLMLKAIHVAETKPAAPQADSAAAVKPIVIRDSAGRFGALSGGDNTSSSPSRMRRVWYWWVTAAFALCYFALLRLSTLVYWIPMLVPLCVAIITTGNTVRRLKWHGFGGVNPFRYRAGIRLTNWMAGLAVGMLFMPGALPPVTVPACVLLSVAGMAMAMGHRQKPA
ncbi:DUF4400 domain-containing protein [Rhodanobacter sp. FW106-PBR-R2A-1-13]|uniref:DUF4400 domain-containing protein n=1 Tax=Rhodanobacter sp. FW106-PBR-R2A-1-13 TaxID=3454845 RepID=UPI0034E4CCF0